MQITQNTIDKLNRRLNFTGRGRHNARTDLAVPFKFVHNEYHESSRVKARPALQRITKRYMSGHGKIRVGTHTGDVFEIVLKQGKGFNFVAAS